MFSLCTHLNQSACCDLINFALLKFLNCWLKVGCENDTGTLINWLIMFDLRLWLHHCHIEIRVANRIVLNEQGKVSPAGLLGQASHLVMRLVYALVAMHGFVY